MNPSPPIQVAKKDSWKLFDQIAHTYDLTNRLISLGIDGLWRKKMLRQIISRPHMRVLDVATGTADLALGLAQLDFIAGVEGIDLSQQMIALGRKKIHRHRYQHKVSLAIGDGVCPDYPDHCFDLATIAFGIRNFSHPTASLRQLYRILKPGGQVLIMEFGLPQNPWIKSPYLFYLRQVLPRVGKTISQHPFAYSYLNRTVESFPYGENFLQMMRAVGFQEVCARPLSFGVAYIYSASKPSQPSVAPDRERV